MKKELLRIFTILFLLVGVAHLTGISTAADMLIHGNADACCNPGEAKDTAPPEPCSIADCSCVSCIAIDVVTTAKIQPSPLEAADVLPCNQSPPPSKFVKAIDYPPENFS